MPRLGFVYKKSSHIPENADRKKQEEFIKRFEIFMANKSPKAPVFFMDASHPKFNSMPSTAGFKKDTGLKFLLIQAEKIFQIVQLMLKHIKLFF